MNNLRCFHNGNLYFRRLDFSIEFGSIAFLEYITWRKLIGCFGNFDE